MRAHSAGIIRLKLLVGYLCDDRFIRWFNRGLDEGSDAVAERFLMYLTKKRNVCVEELYRGLCDFLKANNERGAFELLNLEAIGQ
jgi:hypothetical protein